MRRNLARHADRDAFAAVDQQIRNARRQDFRLDFAFVVIGPEIDGFLVDVFEHRRRDARQPRFGIPHRRRRIAVDGSEISLPVDQRIAQRKRLRHADQRVVNRDVAVRVVLAQHFADDLGALARGAVVMQPQLVHSVKDAPVHRLQPVAHIGQRAADDHAHRVVEIRPPHLVFDVDRNQVFCRPVTTKRHLPAGRRSGRVLWICQGCAP